MLGGPRGDINYFQLWRFPGGCGMHTRLLCPWDSPGKSTGVGCHLKRKQTGTGILCQEIQVCPSLLKSEPGAHGDNQSSLPASAVASLVTNRIQGHLDNSFWHPIDFNL